MEVRMHPITIQNLLTILMTPPNQKIRDPK
jgi:hypothetical protein